MAKSKPRYTFDTPAETVIKLTNDVLSSMAKDGRIHDTRYLFLRDAKKCRGLLTLAIRGSLGDLGPGQCDRCKEALEKIENFIGQKSR